MPDLRSLRAELRAAGAFEHHELRGWLKLGLLLAVVAACLIGLAELGAWSAWFLIPIAAIFATAAAMCGHEGSHRSFSRSPFRNALLVQLTFPLFSGLGALYWREKHDRLHHGHPNVEGLDPDIRPFPFVSSRGDHERAGAKERWFQRKCQRWAFWPMSLLLSVGMRRSSLIYLAQYPRKHGFRRAWWLEVGCLTVHYTAWIVVPSLVWGPLVGFGVYASLWAIVGTLLTLVFAPAHIGLPIMASQNHDWLHQLETTRNLALPRIVSFFFIGLDRQVEHHLFPKIPHPNLPKATAITEAWCARQGVPHLTVPYLHALADSHRFISDAWEREAMDPVAVRAGLVGA